MRQLYIEHLTTRVFMYLSGERETGRQTHTNKERKEEEKEEEEEKNKNKNKKRRGWMQHDWFIKEAQIAL